MCLYVYSDEPQATRLISELARERVVADSKIGVASSADEADVCLRDISALIDDEISRLAAPTKQTIYIVSRDQASRLHYLLPDEFPRVIVKPVQKRALQALINACRPSNEAAMRADQDALLQALLEANLQLQKQEQRRTTFLCKVLDDFATPLTSLLADCTLLLSIDSTLSSEQTEIIQRMQHSVRRMSRIISATLDLNASRMEEPQWEMRPENIQAAVSQAVHEILPMAIQKGITITVGVEPAVLLFERSRMEQVVMNLLENACKYTPRGGAISVRGWPVFEGPKAASYCVEVADTGEGIPTGKRASVFDEGVADPEVLRRGGSGLGLAICKMFIKSFNGRIRIEDSRQGCVFSFDLPIPSCRSEIEVSNNSEEVVRTGA